MSPTDAMHRTRGSFGSTVNLSIAIELRSRFSHRFESVGRHCRCLMSIEDNTVMFLSVLVTRRTNINHSDSSSFARD